VGFGRRVVSMRLVSPASAAWIQGASKVLDRSISFKNSSYLADIG
jgi:hypothetical protein